MYILHFESTWTSIWFSFFNFFAEKLVSVAQSLMSQGTKSQILDPRYGNVLALYNTVFTFYEQKRTLNISDKTFKKVNLFSFIILTGISPC